MLSWFFGWFYLNKHPEGTVPNQVIAGTFMLYFALLLQMISNLLDGINLAAFIFLFGFLFYFIFMTGEGRKWARIVMLILILFNSYVLVANITHPAIAPAGAVQPAVFFKTPVFLTGLFILEVVLELIAMALLFSTQAKEWFGRVRTKVN